MRGTYDAQPSPVEQLHAAFARVCERLGCTDGPVDIYYDILRLAWVATHGRHEAHIERLTIETGVDHLREWFIGIHTHLEDAIVLRDRWPIRAIDPLMGG